MATRIPEATETSGYVVSEPSYGGDAIGLAVRFAAAVVALVPVIIGLIALVRIDWKPAGMDAPAVTVAGMSFRPWIAIATVVLGLLALAAAVSWDRASKLFVGALLVALGIVVLVASPTLDAVVLNDRMGWMAIITGAVLALSALVLGWLAARPVRHREGVRYE